MNYIKTILLCIVVLFLNLSCNEDKVTFNKITCKIPNYINIKDDEIYAQLKNFHLDSASHLYLEITIYSYSTGLESIIISDDEDIKNVIETGKIKGLIKITDGKKILSADFIEASGSSKEKIISALIDKIRVKYQPLFPF
ncbi:MAG: hypothetical protein FWF73_05065 [Spirochaetes bacterium]|nr:hypothetical protein [Spirochaetota bacterium]